ASSRWHSRTSFKASRRFALASSTVSPCEIAAGISSTKQVYPPSLAGSKTAVSLMLIDYHANVLSSKATPLLQRQSRLPRRSGEGGCRRAEARRRRVRPRERVSPYPPHRGSLISRTQTSGRETPPETCEPGVVSVEGDPLTAGFDRQCGKPSIGRKIATRIGFFAKAGEDGPMLRSGSNQDTMRLIHQQFAKADYFIKPARLGENPGMRCDTDDSAQHLGRHPVAGVTINDAFQPPAT